MDISKLINDVEKESLEWKNFANLVVSVMSFMMGLGCICTNAPQLFGFISLFFVISIQISSGGVFPIKF